MVAISHMATVFNSAALEFGQSSKMKMKYTQREKKRWDERAIMKS